MSLEVCTWFVLIGPPRDQPNAPLAEPVASVPESCEPAAPAGIPKPFQSLRRAGASPTRVAPFPFRIRRTPACAGAATAPKCWLALRITSHSTSRCLRLPTAVSHLAVSVLKVRFSSLLRVFRMVPSSPAADYFSAGNSLASRVRRLSASAPRRSRSPPPSYVLPTLYVFGDTRKRPLQDTLVPQKSHTWAETRLASDQQKRGRTNARKLRELLLPSREVVLCGRPGN